MCFGPDELPGGAHLEPGMGTVLVVVLEPPGDLAKRGAGVRQGADANIVALEGSDKGLRHAIGLWLATGVKHGARLSAVAKSWVFLAVSEDKQLLRIYGEIRNIKYQ